MASIGFPGDPAPSSMCDGGTDLLLQIDSQHKGVPGAQNQPI
jgi:hypothetical protein